jgi:hypothetical protein
MAWVEMIDEQIICLFRLGFAADDATDGANNTVAQIVAVAKTATRANSRLIILASLRRIRA